MIQTLHAFGMCSLRRGSYGYAVENSYVLDPSIDRDIEGSMQTIQSVRMSATRASSRRR